MAVGLPEPKYIGPPLVLKVLPAKIEPLALRISPNELYCPIVGIAISA